MNKLKNIWYAVRFKINELELFERNLKNQKFIFYIPKFTKKVRNNKLKIISLFPGYGFVKNTNLELNALRYTRGVIDIVKFGDNYAFIEDEIIKHVKDVENISQTKPIEKSLSIGDEISIRGGPFKDYISRVISLPAKDRVTVLMSLLGSDKNITLPIDLIEKT